MILARDVMTADVVSVSPTTPVREIAALLAAKRISAVPVLDPEGAPLGMVSEGDLIGRNAADPETRRSWWLDLLAEGEPLSADYIASLRPTDVTATAVMSGPVIAVEETTDIVEIARLLHTYRIKRVPVLRDGRVVGIVSRADLVQALAASPPPPAGETIPTTGQGLFGAIAAIEHRFRAAPSAPGVVAPATPITRAASAQRFRELAATYRHREHAQRDEVQREAADRLRHELDELTAHHLDEPTWQAALGHAVEAAEHGEHEFMLLRFPNALCSDGGRAINAPSPDWPKTLRGEAAEIYLRWERDLKPLGFHLGARVLEFPGGFPGDIGLFLSWDA